MTSETLTPAAMMALLTATRQVALEAGEAIMEVYGRDFAVNRKGDDSPVTEADLRANEVIRRGLVDLEAGWPVLTEEGRLPGWSERRAWTRYWLVDPLDGTREFVNRNDEFTVNIALIEDDQPILGVVYAPALDVLYGAVREVGVWRWHQGEQRPIGCHPLEPGRPIRVAISRSHMSARDQALLDKLGDCEVIRCGSALKSCLIAEGNADLYPRLGPTSEWDTAASQCVLETAGGFVTDMNMRRLRYNRRESVLNPPFFAFGPPWRDWSEFL